MDATNLSALAALVGICVWVIRWVMMRTDRRELVWAQEMKQQRVWTQTLVENHLSHTNTLLDQVAIHLEQVARLMGRCELAQKAREAD